MTRVKDVIDCWFDSGSMPFAQWHYPFENEDKFNDQFPADFICEGIDQTRGWFYSLICISTFLKGVSPYRNVLVNDLILDAKGQKMSKSRGNTVDPFELFDKYGADALRWYLLYVSPAWTPTRFDEEGLKEVISKFFTTFRNVYAFFALYANTDGVDPVSYEEGFTYTEEIDDWLISEYNLLVKNCRQYMDEYDTTKTVRAIQEFVNEDLSNWYIRRNRRRFWESGLSDSKKAVFLTTYRVLEGICRLAAPFAPYVTEEIYRDLTGKESVHLADYPTYDEALINEKLNYRMNTVRTLVSLGRSAREDVQIKVRQPLAYVMVDAALKDDIGYLADLIKEELNVKDVRFEENLADYMDFTVKPDFKVCGKQFGSKVKALASYLASVDASAFMKDLGEKGQAEVEIEGETLTLTRDMLDVRISAREGFDVQMQDNLFIILNTELTEDLVNEGYAREIISKVQQLRKSSGYEVADRIRLTVSSDETVIRAVEAFRDYICRETLSQELTVAENSGEKVSLNGHDAYILTERI